MDVEVCVATPFHPKLIQFSLQTLNIDSNKIARIPYKPRSVSPNNSIKTLILSRNEIKDWISVDALALQVPQLESLSLTDCPIMSTRRLLYHQMALKSHPHFRDRCR